MDKGAKSGPRGARRRGARIAHTGDELPTEPLIDAPFAATPFTVAHSRLVSNCQIIDPLAAEYARTPPSCDPASTAPGIAEHQAPSTFTCERAAIIASHERVNVADRPESGAKIQIRPRTIAERSRVNTGERRTATGGRTETISPWALHTQPAAIERMHADHGPTFARPSHS